MTTTLDPQRLSSPGSAIVIGGGVVGAACAYYLARANWRVTLIERDALGQGCSHGNCGLLCLSQTLPLAQPGVVQKTLRALLQRNAPLSIQLRLDPALWSWLLKFASRCNRHDMLAAGHVKLPLLQSSMALYDALRHAERFECERENQGLLLAYQTSAEFEAYSATDQLLRAEFALPATRLAGAALCDFEPALRPGLPGGWLYEGDAHLRPDRLMAAWRRVLERTGVTIREHCEVREFVRDGPRARAIQTAAGEQVADVFVVATGAFAPQLERTLGCRIPIQPGKGYSITMPRPAKCPHLPVMFPEHKVVATPFQSGYRLGSTMEFAGYDLSLHRRRLAFLRTGASHYLQEPACEPIEEEWCGLRPMTFDDVPIIGPVPSLKNVCLAAGHGMLGVSMAPATGKLVAELLSAHPPHVDPQPYAVTRF